jgi:hypothetical protein
MKALSKKREKSSFWTAIFFLPKDLPDITLHEFYLPYGVSDQIEVVSRKATAEKLARARLRELNEEMLHPEDQLWRYKLIELRGGKH